jgi:alanyl-tRNA synthetase
LIEQNTALQKSISAYQNKEVGDLRQTLKSKIQHKDGVDYIIQQVEIPTADALKNLAFELQSESQSLFCLLVAEIDGKANLALAISKELTENKSLNAGTIIRQLAKEVQGGGGGQAFLATAGGQNPSGIQAVLKLALTYL